MTPNLICASSLTHCIFAYSIVCFISNFKYLYRLGYFVCFGGNLRCTAHVLPNMDKIWLLIVYVFGMKGIYWVNTITWKECTLRLRCHEVSWGHIHHNCYWLNLAVCRYTLYVIGYNNICFYEKKSIKQNPIQFIYSLLVVNKYFFSLIFLLSMIHQIYYPHLWRWGIQSYYFEVCNYHTTMHIASWPTIVRHI